ncbi:hypothetical protein RSSM_01048 [Rhodopirellula sallentina SM41]|uniref:Uncharacterized protein n=1 Tax=Rhodopirellula sallentina SM41 TaxID=1263870 RepID=M5U8A0_9BACT|nr:hypothetical protein RSSM_01048 [Rhodopirellula sallentina SM41]
MTFGTTNDAYANVTNAAKASNVAGINPNRKLVGEASTIGHRFAART